MKAAAAEAYNKAFAEAELIINHVAASNVRVGKAAWTARLAHKLFCEMQPTVAAFAVASDVVLHMSRLEAGCAPMAKLVCSATRCTVHALRASNGEYNHELKHAWVSVEVSATRRPLAAARMTSS